MCYSADHITSLKARIVPRALWELDTLEKFMWAWLHFNKIWAPVFLWLPLKISSCNKLITTGKQTSHFRARYVQSLAEVTGGLTLCSSWGSDPETICFVLGKKKKSCSFLSISNRQALDFKSIQLPSARMSFNHTGTLEKMQERFPMSKMNLNNPRVEQQTH